MWSAYSTRSAAEFVGLSESAIRGCVHAGLIGRSEHGAPLRFSFQDILILKIVRDLVANGVSIRRARRELGVLRGRLPDGAVLSSMSIVGLDGHVVVRAEERAYRADSGQLVFDFELAPQRGELTAMPIRCEAPGPEPVPVLGADEWFEHALALEEGDPKAAIEAYERVLRHRPDCPETLVNVGRMYAETGELDAAQDRFERALAVNPRDATALYNLGVVAQDCGRDAEAMQLYHGSLDLDPNLAEAHYNLATIFDRTGDPRAAIRHINEYRKLTRR